MTVIIGQLIPMVSSTPQPPGQVMTHVAISEGETPDDSKCVIGKVTGNTVAVTIFGANGR